LVTVISIKKLNFLTSINQFLKVCLAPFLMSERSIFPSYGKKISRQSIYIINLCINVWGVARRKKQSTPELTMADWLSWRSRFFTCRLSLGFSGRDQKRRGMLLRSCSAAGWLSTRGSTIPVAALNRLTEDKTPAAGALASESDNNSAPLFAKVTSLPLILT
jgi:hypothetical protein